MKKIRVAALAVALVMLCLAMASCGGSPKVSVNCTITVAAGEEPIITGYQYTVQGTEENPPTVLQATREALQLLEVAYEVDDDGQSFTSISSDGVDYKIGLDEAGENIWAWVYTVDGVEPESGRAGTNPVLEGQNIVFSYVATPLNPEVFSEE